MSRDREQPADNGHTIGRLPDTLRTAWHEFLDVIEPIRPGLHEYCYRLTRHVWDAEDLVQDTLVRGFGRLGQLDRPVRNPRAYLFRIATHLWIDQLRRRETERRHEPEPEPAVESGPEEDRVLEEAGGALLTRLPPRERAAMALKDGFGLSLAEVAEILGTSVGAVKAALHRGRARLDDSRLDEWNAEPGGQSTGAGPSRELLDRFVALFRAGDAAALADLLQDHASVELVGCNYEDGPEHDWFSGLIDGHPEWPAEWRYEAQRLEHDVVLGERVLLVFRTRRSREKLEQVVRLEEQDGRIVQLRDYGFCPDTTRAVGRRLDLPVRAGPYRYPTPSPGGSWIRE